MNNSVIIIRNNVPTEYGGAEYYQLLFASVLKKQHITPVIISNSEKLIKKTNEKNIKIIIPPYKKRQNWSGWRNVLLPSYFLWQIRSYFWYKKQIKTINPQAIFIQSRDELICATLAAKKNKKPCYWIDHADFRTWVLQNIDKPFKNMIGKLIIKLANTPERIIMISDFEYKNFKHIINKHNLKNVIVVKNGVIDEKEKYKYISPKEKGFCYIGRLTDNKGINEMINAFISLDDNEAELNIYGEINDKYQKKARGNKKIIFHGFTDDPLLAIAKSKNFILPSYHEGLSISLLQATMLGKTIIATSIDGNPEVVINNKTGILVPPKNPEAITEAMREILKNPEKAAKLAKNAREKYEKEFDFEKTVKEQIIGRLV